MFTDISLLSNSCEQIAVLPHRIRRTRVLVTKYRMVCRVCTHNPRHEPKCDVFGFRIPFSQSLLGLMWLLLHVSMFVSCWWLVRVTLVVAFGFLIKHLGRRWGPMNGTLSFYEYRFSGGDTQTLPYAKEFVWSFYTHRQQGCKNFGHECSCHCMSHLSGLRCLEKLSLFFQIVFSY